MIRHGFLFPTQNDGGTETLRENDRPSFSTWTRKQGGAKRVTDRLHTPCADGFFFENALVQERENMKTWNIRLAIQRKPGSAAQKTNLPLRLGFISGAVLGLFMLLALSTSIANAAERDFTLRYDVLATGANLAQIGNGLTTCQSGTNNLEHSSLSCAETQGGDNGYSDDWYNDQYIIVNIDVDSDSSTFNSSTATLSIPSGVKLLHAQLYWGGSFNASAQWSQALAQVMKFKGPTGGYHDVTATQLDYKDVTTGSGTGRSYGATVDVTGLFPTDGSWLGSNMVFTGANVKSTTGCTSGNNCPGTVSHGDGSLGNYAGWSLLIVYQDPADTTHTRYVGIDDGLRCVVGVGSSCPNTLNVTFTGFNVPAGSTGNRWGILAWDGDHGTGDNFYLNSVQQSDDAHPVNDYFRSRISVNGSVVTTRNPSYTNNLGIDLVESNTGNFTGGTTQVQARFNTGGELDLLHYFWLVTESTIINYDYGDAPSSFGSASHQLSGNSSATTLRLGTEVTDSEAGMQHSVAANGDNILGTNDEGGVTFPIFRSSATSYSAQVVVTNNFGSAAHVYGWIDLNQNGVFDASEFVSANVANGTTNQTITLTWSSFTPIPAGTILYARFRITTATLTATDATGVAPNGEVEDYRISTVPPTAAILVNFTVQVKNGLAKLGWETGNELNILGFRVWRTGRQNGTFTQINPALIPPKNLGSENGAKYHFQDKTVQPGKRYFYKIQVVGANGKDEWSNVIKVKIP